MIKTSQTYRSPGPRSRIKKDHLQVTLREILPDGMVVDNHLVADNKKDYLELAYKVWQFYKEAQGK